MHGTSIGSGITGRQDHSFGQRRERRYASRRCAVIGLGLLLAFALVVVSFPLPAEGASVVVTLRPNANGRYVEWSKSGGGGKNFERVDESTSDGDGSYVWTSTGAADDGYHMQDLPFGGTVDYVKVFAVVRLFSGTCSGGLVTDPKCIQFGYAVNPWGVGGGGAHRFGSTYTVISDTWTTMPYSTVPWTAADVNVMEIFLMKMDSTSTVRATQVWIEVSITPAPSLVKLRPNANGPWLDWSKSGGGGKNFDRVDETTSDGDGTYVYTSRASYDSYELQDIPFAGTVDFVTVRALARVSSGICQVGTVVYPGCLSLAVNLGPSYSIYGGGNRFVLNYTYATVSHTYTVNPWTGQPWTVAELSALKVVLIQNDGESTVRVTQVWVEVQITPTG